MKAIQIIGLICLTMLSLSACKKSEVNPQTVELDLDNIMNYYVVIKHHKYTQSHAVAHYLHFENRGKFDDIFIDMNIIGRSGNLIIQDNILDFTSSQQSIYRFEYKQGELISILDNPQILKAKLVKIPSKNPFAGKTFVGKYYKQNGTVLHQSFFYQFNEDGTKVSAGLNYPTIIRTSEIPLVYLDDAYINSPSSNYAISERFIHDGEKLHVTYQERGINENYYGEFVELK